MFFSRTDGDQTPSGQVTASLDYQTKNGIEVPNSKFEEMENGASLIFWFAKTK